ncbi:hypothetical protein [Mycolicibacterium palauense]|uniref:hypothetical protein n=1 Tax=Mycolicibacterium palauense TaxID=2034511 RepID=UPI000BFEEC1F|nr:hypothetical protein [Mycolicibacterium palauense]
MAENSDHPGGALHAYAHQVLAGTGLTETDAYAIPSDDDEGSAVHALQHGWELACRAAKVAAQ